ncbi:hypothetical protein FHS43_002216 [Streptosporangium becharense]|uniref:Uncharacterized protein n=1 Tax=Streptosporangium becharense TaxID=1816182 RepID=A0A7W9IK99_9ACTN|nr:hypothetical protein [Streptosporangium becharense]MBB2910951.1 hypothetical protein [Streptosporangium becharense]MBB5821990.1 hypothetical protein [Streptosporangium becharense]
MIEHVDIRHAHTWRAVTVTAAGRRTLRDHLDVFVDLPPRS